MSANQPLVATYILTEQTLFKLDNEALHELLNHKTRLYLATRQLGIAEKDYSKRLSAEINAIQMEIKRRNLT